MKKMKEMLRMLNEARKEDPKEFWGIIALMLAISGYIYGSMWLIAILEGNR